MNNELKIKVYAFTLDCTDHRALAKFYAELLHWVVVFSDEEFASVGPAGIPQGGYPGLTFQRNPAYQPPVCPDTPEAQQQMAHLDFAVNDVEQAVEHALNCGATMAEEQFNDGWKVMFDPAGHPFCLCQAKSLMETPTFALL